jgi:2-desacetyl-2-hydroxyethyl bacteriochlorophyllide A dehydrogenase
MERRVIFTGQQQVALETFDLPSPERGEVRVRTRVSLVSTGTELIVFNRLFEPGTSWDSWVKYPFRPGYTACGVVEMLGPEVTGVNVGDRVVIRGGHTSALVAGAEHCIRVPDGIADEDAAWFGLAKIAAMGARVAKPALGTSVAVVGAGPIGQMAVRWCVAAGAFPVISVDTVKMRVELAVKGGASHGIAKPLGAALEEVNAICGGEGPEIVIDSTGFHQVFPDALRAARRFGKVILLGDTGTPSQQHLTHDLINKGLTLAGAHDTHEDATWNCGIITRLFFHLVTAGRFTLDGLNTHSFKPEQVAEAYRVANERRAETMGIYFDWR